MKNIVISADGDRIVYSVPNTVADNLEQYCMDFYDWLENSPQAKRYRRNKVLCFNEADFIEYLNDHVFLNEQSVYVANLSLVKDEHLLKEYGKCPRFNF